MTQPISAVGTSATWQARLAAMQQQLTQSLFQSADVNGDGAVSKSEFESFYSKFTSGGASQTPTAAQTAAADQIFQQFDTQGAGKLNSTQFAAALKQIMSQQAQGHHQHHVAGTVGAATQGALPSNALSAANTPVAALESLFSTTSAQNVMAEATPPENAGSLEFTA
jgi:hypothetical protein